MRRIAVLLSVASLALVAAAPSSAQAERHLTLDNNVSFIGGFISARCGFPVTTTFSGVVEVTLFYDRSGRLTHEVDRFPDGRVTYTGPTGRSATYPISGVVFFTRYPQGAFIGAPAIVVATGDLSHFPGFFRFFLSPGIYVLRDTVVDFTPEGIPLTAGPLVQSIGVDGPSQEENMDAICNAISP